MDASDLRRLIVDWSRENVGRAPTSILEALRAVVVELDEAGVAIAPPPVSHAVGGVAHQSPATDPAAAPRVRLGVENERIVARDERAAPIARTFNVILDTLAQRKLSRRASELLEIAAHLEAVELQNAELHAILDEMRAAKGER